jgi:CRP-like cAMP-binding protein
MKIKLGPTCLNKFELTDRLKEFGRERVFSKGDVLYNKGDRPSGLYYIKEGLVGLINLAPNGSESLLRVFGEQFFIGYRSFIVNEEYHATSIALTDVKLVYFPFKSAEEILGECPHLLLHLSQMLARDLRIAEERFNDLTGKRVINRIIESLIFLQKRQPDYQWTRREIGEFCGAKTETVTRVLTKLEKEGFIKKDGRTIDIVNVNELLDYSEELELSV